MAARRPSSQLVMTLGDVGVDSGALAFGAEEEPLGHGADHGVPLRMVQKSSITRAGKFPTIRAGRSICIAQTRALER